MKILRRLLCFFGWHGKPEYYIANFDVRARCSVCKRVMIVDSKGDLFG